MRLKIFTAALLGATMLCSSTAFAAELDTKAKTEDLNYLYETLKSVHPDIFYNNTEERFLEKKAEIEQSIYFYLYILISYCFYNILLSYLDY